MPYVRRTEEGAVTGVFACKQPGYAEEFLEDEHPEVLAYRGITAPPTPAEDKPE